MTDTLSPGELAPRFRAPALGGNPDFVFDSVAGRYVVMLFFGSASQEDAAQALLLVEENAALFDDDNAIFFGVTTDPEDETEHRIESKIPGRRFFLDFGRKISTGYGALGEDGKYRPHWLLFDIDLCVIAKADIGDGAALLNRLKALQPVSEIDRFAPVLVVPNLFERDVCARLIELYDEHGGEDSGFMREVDGKTVAMIDHSHKRRADWAIEDETLRASLRAKIEKRLLPQIRKAYQFPVSRMERYMVARYDSNSGGYFRPHRDNTTAGTAHRRFACTINLNADDYEGGDLRFPEYGHRTYRAPTGGAVIFSCSLLHEARPVTKGQRYCFLPFFYDEAAAEIREANNSKLSESIQAYRR